MAKRNGRQVTTARALPAWASSIRRPAGLAGADQLAEGQQPYFSRQQFGRPNSTGPADSFAPPPQYAINRIPRFVGVKLTVAEQEAPAWARLKVIRRSAPAVLGGQ
jgi:hypothetical protein